MASPETIDYYVLHCAADGAAARSAALRRWAREHHQARGVWPRVWLDALCADPYLERAQLLAHEVVAMCRSRRMLILLSPALLECLPCVGRLLAWRSSGGVLADVALAVVGESAAELRAAIAAVDAFHVLYARRALSSGSLGGAARLDDGQQQGGALALDTDGASAEHRAFTHAVQLAGAARVNAEVRALLPAVEAGVEAAERELPPPD